MAEITQHQFHHHIHLAGYVVRMQRDDLPTEVNSALAMAAKAIQQLGDRIDQIRKQLESIVETTGGDKGVIYLSHESTTHYDPEHKCQVYDHENFSPLGDALIELYEITGGLK